MMPRAMFLVAMCAQSTLGFFQSSTAFSQGSALNAATTGLEKLASLTTLSIDSGDLDVIAEWASTGLITDATTNPLFVAQAGTNPQYALMVDKALAYARENCGDETPTGLAMDRIAVELGLEIVKLVPGYVSTEVDIRASFDVEETLRRARRIIAMYEAEGVGRERILVKVAGTYEGIKAAEILEKEGISTNITLIFGFAQAVLAAQAGARLISPFPGRILDWHKQDKGFERCENVDDDPGVISVKKMFDYYKKYNFDKTICMPASWRPSRGTSDPTYAVDEIVALAGVDRMTIPQNLLQILSDMSADDIPRRLDAADSAHFFEEDELPPLSESHFRLLMNEDVCATTKLAEGINAFVAETLKLEKAVEARL